MRQLWLLTAVAVLAVFAVGYFALISPQTKKAAEVRTQVDAAEVTNRTLQTQIAMLKQQAKQLPREQARLAELAKKMPNNPALPSLVRSISDTADAAHVDLLALNPNKPTVLPGVPAAAPAAPVAAGTTAATTTVVPVPTVALVPLELRVWGNFAQMREFITGLEELQRSFLVAGFDFHPSCRPPDGAQPPDDCDPLKLELKLQARVFMTAPQSVARPVTPVAPAASTEGN